MSELKRQLICIAKAKHRTGKGSIRNFQELMDEKATKPKPCTYHDDVIPDITSLLELAKAKEKFYKVNDGKIKCSLIVVSESDELEFSETEIDVTFGSARSRPKMMTSVGIKTNVLTRLQRVEEDKISKNEYKGVMVGLKGLESLVLIPLQNTRMREEELEQAYRQQGQEAEENIHRRSDLHMRKKMLRLLIALKDHIHQFEEGVIHAFETKIVIGGMQKLTQSQVGISKLFWRILFDGHDYMMSDKIIAQAFQTRPRNPRRREISDTAGKTPEYQQDQQAKFKRVKYGKAAKHVADTITLEEYDDAPTMQRVLLESLESNSGDMGDATKKYLTMFVEKYLEIVGNDAFIANLTPSVQHPMPEDALLESIPALLEDPQCSNLKHDLDAIDRLLD